MVQMDFDLYIHPQKNNQIKLVCHLLKFDSSLLWDSLGSYGVSGDVNGRSCLKLSL